LNIVVDLSLINLPIKSFKTLVRMKILYRNWYANLEKELEICSSLKIISPFVSEYFFQKIKSEFSLSNIELITRFSLPDFANGVSKLEALKLLIDNNAIIFGIKDLHSKVYIFDDNRAIISSANLTRNGLNNNFECGILLNSRKEIENLLGYFNKLKNIAHNNIFNNQKYELWKEKIKNCEIINTPQISLEDFGSIEVGNIDPNRTYYIKFLGTNNAREPLTSSSKEELNRSLCHYACGFNIKKRPRQINEGDIIYLARMTKEPNDYSIFGKAVAIKYKDNRDFATENEIKQRPWKKDWPVYLRLKNGEYLDGTLGNFTLMGQLIHDLKYFAFESTKQRFLKGERNINPWKSLSQQPYIKLSLEGAKWVDKRFSYDKYDNGLVDETFLNNLPKSDTNI